jgi:hypothetical protein
MRVCVWLRAHVHKRVSICQICMKTSMCLCVCLYAFLQKLAYISIALNQKKSIHLTLASVKDNIIYQLQHVYISIEVNTLAYKITYPANDSISISNRRCMDMKGPCARSFSTIDSLNFIICGLNLKA